MARTKPGELAAIGTPPDKTKPIGRIVSGPAGFAAPTFAAMQKGKAKAGALSRRSSIEEIPDVDAPTPPPRGLPLQPVLREARPAELVPLSLKTPWVRPQPLNFNMANSNPFSTPPISSLSGIPMSAPQAAAMDILYNTRSPVARSESAVSHYESTAGRSPSVTPSLNSLQHVSPSPAPTKSSDTERDPSQSNNDYPLLFDNGRYWISLRDEPLQQSLHRYHPAYSPWEDDDPLAVFGAVDGFLPGRSLEESTLVRNLLFRWTAPHNDLIWMNLREGIDTFIKRRFKNTDLIKYDDDSAPNKISYTLNQPRLQELAHVVLATEQILNGLSLFIYRDKPNQFKLDPGFKFIKMIGWHSNRAEILLTIQTLQTRIPIAVKHIENFFEGIKRTFLDDYDNESLNSLDSTVTSIRSTFGVLSPRTELAKLSQRSDYRQGKTGAVATAQHLLTSSLQNVPETFYHHRSKNDQFRADLFRPLSRVGNTMRTDNAVPATPSKLLSPSHPTMDNAASATHVAFSPSDRTVEAPSREGTSITAALQNKNIRFQLPESISGIARAHPISSLPSMGKSPFLGQSSSLPPLQEVPIWSRSQYGGPLMKPTTATGIPLSTLENLNSFSAGPAASSNSNLGPSTPRQWSDKEFAVFDGRAQNRENPPHLNPNNLRDQRQNNIPQGGMNAAHHPHGAEPHQAGPPGGIPPGGGQPGENPGNGLPNNPPGGGPPGGGLPGGGPPGSGPPGGGPPGGGPPGGDPPNYGNQNGGPPRDGNPEGGIPNFGRQHPGHPGGDPPDGGNGGKPPQGGGGPPGPRDNAPYPRRPYDEDYTEEWQLNHKLNLSSVPWWDGKGKSALNYLSEMANMARLGDKMRKDLAELAPLKWTGSAKSWWEVLPSDNQLYFMQDWSVMLLGIRQQFLDATWINN
ncbi:hypothetical protein Hypma_013492 [Hypsizygus marmoreus]|uniref:Uncharacterized protein n=1 Tax=Hypsizygus marmoreus TaxID=39966 RepID=A0A369JF58_HYPMA|nr:hypothetical protein Hypma_013492 [Hypsizygus marmoreus]